MPDGETRISFAYKEIPSLARRSDVDVEGRWIDADLVQGALYLRTWTPGDSLQQSAKSEKVKIKLLFQEGRVPLWERKFWPVLALGAGDEAEVVWTRKFGVARRFQAGPESRRVLEVWVGSVEE
uniref:Lysidine-tRNA(Ile) synthetase C-terminal domain-containing protein n=1 Tax=Tolypothrix bouteillei VB521301 TaxID=1479485 RepID=A0A0C1RPT1_9CYAN